MRRGWVDTQSRAKGGSDPLPASTTTSSSERSLLLVAARSAPSCCQPGRLEAENLSEEEMRTPQEEEEGEKGEGDLRREEMEKARRGRTTKARGLTAADTTW